MTLPQLMAIATFLGYFRNWLHCYLRHGGHAWTRSSSRTGLIQWRRCDRCTFTVVYGPAGRLRTFDVYGAFDPARHVPPLPATREAP